MSSARLTADDYIEQQNAKKFIKHLSERPWSEYTKADYSIEQWHNACLIHQHEGAPTSKSECKLPVKTPNGAVNRNAVHSAAAALAGARGGVHASSDEKDSAARSLVRLYRQMDEEPPPSLLSHSLLEDMLEHYGTKGMRWGVRKPKVPIKPSSDYKKTAAYRKRHPTELSNKQLQNVNARIKLEQTYQKNLPPKKGALHLTKGKRAVAEILSVAGTAAAVYNLRNNPALRAMMAAGAKKTAQIASSKAAQVPFEQLKLF